MRKVFCDRCGGECLNYYVSLEATSNETTSRGEYLDSDRISSDMHLCRHCGDSFNAWMGRDVIAEARQLMIARRERYGTMEPVPEDTPEQPPLGQLVTEMKAHP